MTPKPTPPRLVFLGAALCLQACASAPPTKPAAAAAPSTPTPTVQMAPIPNPEKAERAQPRQSHEAPPREERPVRRPEPRTEESKPPPPPPAPAATTAPRDPSRAARLRAQGLVQLNRGAVDRALALLREAQRLDPNDALIKRDLQRAERISRAVNAKP